MDHLLALLNQARSALGRDNESWLNFAANCLIILCASLVVAKRTCRGVRVTFRWLFPPRQQAAEQALGVVAAAAVHALAASLPDVKDWKLTLGDLKLNLSDDAPLSERAKLADDDLSQSLEEYELEAVVEAGLAARERVLANRQKALELSQLHRLKSLVARAAPSAAPPAPAPVSEVTDDVEVGDLVSRRPLKARRVPDGRPVGEGADCNGR